MIIGVSDDEGAEGQVTMTLRQPDASLTVSGSRDDLRYLFNYPVLAITDLAMSGPEIPADLPLVFNMSLTNMAGTLDFAAGDPRIHFAINCASQSCPKLLSMAYSADTLEKQLDANTREFINDPTRNRFDQDKKIAYVSKIFHWFKEDFAQHSGSVQKYLATYVADPAIADDLANERYKIKYMKYDWRLNGTAPKVEG